MSTRDSTVTHYLLLLPVNNFDFPLSANSFSCGNQFPQFNAPSHAILRLKFPSLNNCKESDLSCHIELSSRTSALLSSLTTLRRQPRWSWPPKRPSLQKRWLAWKELSQGASTVRYSEYPIVNAVVGWYSFNSIGFRGRLFRQHKSWEQAQTQGAICARG